VTNPIARRYATALFDVVGKINGVERAEQDLAALKALLASNPELAAAFASAAIPPRASNSVWRWRVSGSTTPGWISRSSDCRSRRPSTSPISRTSRSSSLERSARGA